MIVRKQGTQLWVLILPVIGLWYLALWLTILIRYPAGISANNLRIHYVHFSVIFLLWALVMFIYNLFDLKSFRRYTTLVRNIVVVMTINFFIAIVYFYVQPTLILTPRRFLLMDVFISFVVILVWNLLLKQWLSRQAPEYIYLFSREYELAELEKEISDHAFLGLRIGGHITSEEASRELGQLDINR